MDPVLEVQDFSVKSQPGYQLACRIIIQCHPIIGTICIYSAIRVTGKEFVQKVDCWQATLVLPPRSCQNGGVKSQDRGYLEIHGSLT